MWLALWRLRVLTLQRDAFALVLSLLDGRVPASAKLLTLAMLAYTVSPVDLVPDVVPLLGFMDDLGVVAGGASVARGLIPAAVFDVHRGRADRQLGVLTTLLLGSVLLVVAVTSALLWLVLR